MKAIKSKLVKDILKSDVKLPLENGARFKFNGVWYEVKIVPKAK